MRTGRTWTREKLWLGGVLSMLVLLPALALALDVKGNLTATGAIRGETLTCPATTTTTDLTLTTDHCQINVTTGTNIVVLTLPPASGLDGRRYTIVKVDAPLGKIRLTPNGTDTIQGVNRSLDFTSQSALVQVAWESNTGWSLMSGPLILNQTEATALTECRRGQLYLIFDAQAGEDVWQRCADDESGLESLAPKVATNLQNIFNTDSGVTGIKYTATEISTDTILSTERIQCVTVGALGVTLRLPPALQAPISEYTLIICDSGTGTLTLVPDGADLLNGVNAPVKMSGQWAIMDIRLIGGNLWHIVDTRTITGPASGGSGTVILSPNNVKFPATNPAVLDNSATLSRILFDNVTPQCIFWQFIMPKDYASTPVFDYIYSMVSVTAGSHHLDISLWVVSDNGDDADTESYDTANNCNDSAVPAQAGDTHTISCPLTTTDGLAGGKLTMLRACRDIANDDAAGVSEFRGGILTYAK